MNSGRYLYMRDWTSSSLHIAVKFSCPHAAYPWHNIGDLGVLGGAIVVDGFGSASYNWNILTTGDVEQCLN